MAPENKNKTIKKIAILIIKLSVSSALLYFIISKIGAKTIVANMKLLNPMSFIAAVFMYMVAAYISSLRWNLLIPQDMKTNRLFSLYMIGSFFNHCLPGIIGGDAVKAYYLSKELKVKEADSSRKQEKTEDPSLTIAIASVFMDRYIGFSALLTVSIIAFPFGAQYLSETPVKLLMPVLLVVFILSSVVVFKFRIGDRFRFLSKVYEYFHMYTKKREALLKAFVYSLFIQLLGIISIYILSKGIALYIPFLFLLIFVPIIILISFIPVSISGIGLREGAFAVFLGTIGVPSHLSVTLAMLWFLSIVVSSLWGLFEYLRFKTVLGRQKIISKNN